jgi:single-stranded DNA-binding protein
MNHCMLMAEIVSVPQLRYTQDNQTPIAEFAVVFPGLRAEDPTQQMKVIGWGNLAQEMQEGYVTGDRVLLEGRLSMNTVDRPEGFKEKQAEMTAQRIYKLKDLGTLPMALPAELTVTAAAASAAGAAPAPATPPAATPPTSQEAEVDYDDIPF